MKKITIYEADEVRCLLAKYLNVSPEQIELVVETKYTNDYWADPISIVTAKVTEGG